MTTAGAHHLAGSLPADVNRFIGRRQELAEAKRLLSVTRLLTLTGAGGVGKTRLAFRAAADLHRAFPDRVYLVELATLRDAALLANTVATSLGLLEQSARWRVLALIEHIGDKQMLLVLDNCEHLADAAAVLVDSLLRDCANLRVLATSREPLRVAGESILAVPPLPVPDAESPPPPQALGQYDAVNLFLDRADAVQPGFRITDANHVAVARLCCRLDGLPLALELAAGRLRALSVDEILACLDEGRRVLAAGSRSGPDRQRTLRACIDWSFDLCSGPERDLWALLSVFPGVFDLEAVEGVCATGTFAADDMLDLVVSLVDKSILQCESAGDRTGYRMLEPLREYGADKLRDAGAEGDTRRRHRDWFADLVDRAGLGWISPEQPQWIARLRRNHDSLRAALEFCSSHPGEAPVGFRIATTLEPYWLLRGMLSEGRHWLKKLLSLETPPSAECSRALRLETWLAILQGDTVDAESRIRESGELARSARDVSAAAYVLQTSGMFALFHGDLARGEADLEKAVERFRSVGDVLGEVSTLFYRGLAAGVAGNPGDAARWLDQCLEATESRGECQWRAHALWALGLDAFRVGDSTRASVLEKEALRISRELDGRTGISTVLEALAVIAAAEHQRQRAATLLGATDRLYDSMGSASTRFPALYAHRQDAEQEVRRTLGERAFRAAYERGMAADLDEAIDFALSKETEFGPAGAVKATQRTSLTRRELEITDLITQGLSNRDIARRLVISPRTAESHVEHILSKLGFSNRAQIAAWAAEHRPSAT